MLKDASEAERVERAQLADCARIDAAIRLSEQDIAALEDRQLDLGEIRKQWSAIRDRTILTIRDVVHNITRRANEAKATEQWMIQKLMPAENDDRTIHELSVAFKQTSTRELLDCLRELIEAGDRERIQCLCAVFATREDRKECDATFRKMLAQFALAEYGDFGERLTRISRLAERVDARIANLFSAYRKPTAHARSHHHNSLSN